MMIKSGFSVLRCLALAGAGGLVLAGCQSRPTAQMAEPTRVIVVQPAEPLPVLAAPQQPGPREVATLEPVGPPVVSVPEHEFLDVQRDVAPPERAVIVVPSTARLGQVVQPPMQQYELVELYTIESPTVVEYETLIRAGRPPGYSITTLHTPPHRLPHIVHHDHHVIHRHDLHHRPFSSGTLVPGHDPFAGDPHRSAQLRFHEASRPFVGIRREHQEAAPPVTAPIRRPHTNAPAIRRGGMTVESAAPLRERDPSPRRTERAEPPPRRSPK